MLRPLGIDCGAACCDLALVPLRTALSGPVLEFKQAMESAMLQEHSRPAAQWTSRSAAPLKPCMWASRFRTGPLATFTIVMGLFASTTFVNGQTSSRLLEP